MDATPPGELPSEWKAPLDDRPPPKAGPSPPDPQGGTPAPRPPPPRGRCVVGLWDGTDSWGRNRAAAHRARQILRGAVEPALGPLGLKLRLHDVSRGVPGPKVLGDCRGIVTVFEDFDLRDADAFNVWLAERIDEGRQVVLLGSYGALRDTKTRVPLGPESSNEVFQRLGVRYTGLEWNDAADLEPGRAGADPSVFTRHGPANPRTAGHVRVFVEPASDVAVHQWVSFTNPAEGRGYEIPVVFTSPRGGMVLVRYFEDISGRIRYVDLLAFFRRAGLAD